MHHPSLKWLFVLHEIENKSISCSFDKNYIGTVIQITKVHLQKKYALSAEESVLLRLSDSIEYLIQI